MMRHPEHHHHYQRNRHPPPRIMMPVPGAPHPGVLVSMPSAPPLNISTVNQMQQQQQQPPHQPQQQKNAPNAPAAQQAQAQMYYDAIPPAETSTETMNHHHQQQQQQQAQHHLHQPAQSQQQQQQPQQTHHPAAAPAQQLEPAGSPTSNTTTLSNMPNLANTKEKTPMCLVNELARYNKIQHQYKLTGEQGPAHKKIFTVTLKLGNEEYEAEGASIKKAQHSAAATALEKTQLRRPPPKMARHLKNGMLRTGVAGGVGGGVGGGGMVTPTVELNALAMKRGERTVYIVENGLPPPPPHPHHHPHHHQQPHPPQPQGYMMPYYSRHVYPQGQRFSYDARRNNMRAPYHHHFDRFQFNKGGFHHQPPPPPGVTNGGGELLCSVRLKVGDREYPGTGSTIQAARHDAATRAIEEIKRLNDEQEKAAAAASTALAEHAGDGDDQQLNAAAAAVDINAELKSPISLVHEIALKRHLNVAFEVKSENGPPHMKVFVTQCRIADVCVEGEGHGKKISKKRAAEKMLLKLAQLPPLPAAALVGVQVKRKRVASKKKSRNLVKVNADAPADGADDINPISRLIQIQQANKEKEPVYAVVEERGAARRREFVIQASVNGVSATGVGPNKKLAKRAAAQALLNQLGFGATPPAATTTPAASTALPPSAKVDEPSGNNLNANEKPRKVTFLEEKPAEGGATTTPLNNNSSGRQLVPGLLIVNDQSAVHNKTKSEPEPVSKPKVTPQKITPPPVGGVRSKDKLMYLVQLMNIQAQFSDFPKANHEMYLTLVSLSTNPPQVCHGEGPTIEASHEKAALEALNVLSEMGLDNIVPSKESASAANTSTSSANSEA